MLILLIALMLGLVGAAVPPTAQAPGPPRGVPKGLVGQRVKLLPRPAFAPATRNGQQRCTSRLFSDGAATVVVKTCFLADDR